MFLSSKQRCFKYILASKQCRFIKKNYKKLKIWNTSNIILVRLKSKKFQT